MANELQQQSQTHEEPPQKRRHIGEAYDWVVRKKQEKKKKNEKIKSFETNVVVFEREWPTGQKEQATSHNLAFGSPSVARATVNKIWCLD